MATPLSLHGTLMILMKDVSEGLQLDSADRYQDAYRKYLECLLRITTTLLKKLHNDGGHLNISADLFKTVKLGQQCMDRVSAIVSEKYVPSSKKRQPAGTLPLASPTTPTTPASPRDLVANRPSGSSTPSPSVERGLGYSFSPQTGSPGQSRKDRPVPRSRSGEQLTPMAVASRQNQQLLHAFKARQAQAQRRKDHSMSANLSLTLQRKMAENLAIAKAQEEALAKKMLERQARLEEQAARRFGTPVGLSAEEQHQRQIYRRVLQFELEQPEITDIKTRFEESPTDFELISQLLSAVLGCDNHPLTEQLKQYQNKVLNKLQPMVCDKLPDIENVKVPLGTYLYEKWKTNMKQSKNSENNKGLEDDSNDESMTASENDNKDDEEANENDKLEAESNVNAEDDDNTRSDDSSLEGGRDIGTAVETVKKDIETAMVRGEKLKKKLDNENESLKSLALYTAGEYDKYNQENMDDLFDDDEEDDDNDDEEEVGNNSRADSSLGDCKSITNTNQPEKCSTIIDSGDMDDETITAYRRHLKGIVEDIVQSVEQLALLFVVVYDKLDSAEGRDQCNAQLEASFFQPLWKYLLALFRLSNASEELQLAGIMTARQGCGPASFCVRDKLCLTPSPSTSESGAGDYPYEAAVTELQGVVTVHTMLEKLECIVRTSKLVLQCVEQFYTDQNVQAPSMGADDLVPLLCYVVVRSGLPQIMSECQAVERFLHEGYMFGEEGYCLTSFQTAIDYLTSDKYSDDDQSGEA